MAAMIIVLMNFLIIWMYLPAKVSQKTDICLLIKIKNIKIRDKVQARRDETMGNFGYMVWAAQWNLWIARLVWILFEVLIYSDFQKSPNIKPEMVAMTITNVT